MKVHANENTSHLYALTIHIGLRAVDFMNMNSDSTSNIVLLDQYHIVTSKLVRDLRPNQPLRVIRVISQQNYDELVIPLIIP